ncbi:MAG: DinB family protein [Armatimonadetes bacterium]|nr:DinB family protein [Armatimonadota bacterium]
MTQSITARLDEGKRWFTDLLTELPADEAARSLGEEEWSIAQHVEHLIMTERVFLLGVARSSEPMPERTAEQNEMRGKLGEYLRTGVKYVVNASSVEPSGSKDAETLLADWDKIREKLLAKLDSGTLPGPEIVVFPHPIAGPLNVGETLDFLADHLIYHRIRIEALRTP